MRTVGYACAGLAVALVIFSIFSAGEGSSSGLVPLGLALALLLAAVLMLGSGETKV
jgi:hypothetical protein